jgi:hypothetical protein
LTEFSIFILIYAILVFWYMILRIDEEINKAIDLIKYSNEITHEELKKYD